MPPETGGIGGSVLWLLHICLKTSPRSHWPLDRHFFLDVLYSSLSSYLLLLQLSIIKAWFFEYLQFALIILEPAICSISSEVFRT